MGSLSLCLLEVSVLILSGTTNAGPDARTPRPLAATELRVQFFADGTYILNYTGTWTSADGFFTLPEQKEAGRTVGTCQFRRDKAWTCSSPEREWTDAHGDEHHDSHHTFHGTNYAWTPGGPLKRL